MEVHYAGLGGSQVPSSRCIDNVLELVAILLSSALLFLLAYKAAEDGANDIAQVDVAVI